jgi:tetratricopeptide (TPR) repeat protein
MIARLLLAVVVTFVGVSPIAAQTAAIEKIARDAYQQSLRARTEADYTEIIETIESALQAGVPDNPANYGRNLQAWAYNRRGQLRLDRDALDDALADFNKSVELDPKRHLAYHNRAYILVGRGELEEALEDLNAAVRISPRFVKALRNRGELHYARGNYDGAVADYSAALQAGAEETAELYNLRGHAEFMSGRRQQALADFNRALSLDSRMTEAYINRGDLLQSAGRYEQALADYRSALQSDRASHRALVSQAWLRATAADERFRSADEGLASARRAVELVGERDEHLMHHYLNVLAAAQANAGDFEAAVATQERAIEQAPASLRNDYQKRLDLYVAGQPYRAESEAS